MLDSYKPCSKYKKLGKENIWKNKKFISVSEALNIEVIFNLQIIELMTHVNLLTSRCS